MIDSVIQFFRKKRPFIIGFMYVFNERDIIEELIQHMRRMEVPLVVIDNGSDDGTEKILEEYLGKGILEIRQIKTSHFEIGLLLNHVEDYIKRWNPKWVCLLDADEFLEPPYQGISLKDAVAYEDSLGYNLIQFDHFEFWPTEKDPDPRTEDITNQIQFYSWNDDYQFKCFKNVPGTNLAETGSHLPIFPYNTRVSLSPTKYIMRHYGIRSREHGIKKAFAERLDRYTSHEKKKWGLKKYEKFSHDGASFIIESSKLTRYNNDGVWNRERKFDGLRGYPFPSLGTSTEVEKAMASFRSQIEEIR
ncbi:MAG: hypothetical protein APR54_00550 [Candidatus Cloacimonas sp. SDB]|nr:MAG: hypothetical protein APR54_00550 [Candidatus Cloacimonas sp. SDB]